MDSVTKKIELPSFFQIESKTRPVFENFRSKGDDRSIDTKTGQTIKRLRRWIERDGKITGLWIAGGVGWWQNERNAKRARPVVTWKGPQWLSTGRTHLIHDLISHPVTN